MGEKEEIDTEGNKNKDIQRILKVLQSILVTHSIPSFIFHG
jgi:hypothetical protein